MSLPKTLFVVEVGEQSFIATEYLVNLQQPDGELVGEYRLVRKGRLANQEPVVAWGLAKKTGVDALAERGRFGGGSMSLEKVKRRVEALFWTGVAACIPLSWWMHQFEGVPRTFPGVCLDCWRVKAFISVYAHRYAALERLEGRL